MARLPLGVVRPRGWLQRQLELMRDGTVGHLDELSPFLTPDNGWLHPSRNYAGTEHERDRAGWEEQPYWVRGLYPLAVLTGSQSLLKKARAYIESILSSGDGDGYFGPLQNKARVGKNGTSLPDLFPNMLAIDFLIQYHEETGDPRVVPLLTGFFAFCRDLPEERFLAVAPWVGYEQELERFGDARLDIQYRRAGDMLPHIYWLYNQTGERWLLDLARRFFDHIAPHYPARRHPPVYTDPPEDYLDTHVVHFTQRYGYFGVYGQQEDSEFRLAQGEYWYHQHMATWGQHPRGIFCADELIRSGKTDPRQGFETCAILEFAKHFYELGRLSGDTMYADRVEDIMLNHFPVTHDRENKGLHYLTASNLVSLDKEPGHDLFNDHKGMMLPYSPLSRYPTGYRCCQHNAGFGWPWYVQNLWQETADGGLCLWLYGACQVEAEVGAQRAPVSIAETTDYPFNGRVRLEVTAREPTEFPLYLRIPGWCTRTSVTVDGEPFSTPQRGGYILIETLWRHNRVEIDFEMEVTWTRWARTGAATLDRGPLSYSVRIEEQWVPLPTNPDWPSHEVFPTSPWNYALLHPSQQEPRVTLKPGLADQPWSVEDAPIQITVRGRRLPDWGMADHMIAPLPASPVATTEKVEEITFIPMGCARLRVSCLPICDQ